MERSIDLLTRPLPPYDARWRYGAAASQFADLRLPAGRGPHPVVVGLHGGWWRAAHDLGTHAHLAAALCAAGVATWNVEYRRVGEPGGGWPGTAQDVGAAIDFLREVAPRHGLDLDRVVTVGFSAGGHLALWAAARHRLPAGHPLRGVAPLRLKGAVSLAGAVDLERCAALGLSQGAVQAFLGEAAGDDVIASASPTAMLPLGVPQVLIHGTADTSVPAEVSVRHHAAAVARGDACTLRLLQDVEHFELIDPLSRAWPEVLRQVLDLL